MNSDLGGKHKPAQEGKCITEFGRVSKMKGKRRPTAEVTLRRRNAERN